MTGRLPSCLVSERKSRASLIRVTPWANSSASCGIGTADKGVEIVVLQFHPWKMSRIPAPLAASLAAVALPPAAPADLAGPGGTLAGSSGHW